MLMVQVLSTDDNEKKIHLDAIEILAKELNKATWQINLIYTSILTDLKKKARVKTFLHILASKKVREIIKL